MRIDRMWLVGLPTIFLLCLYLPCTPVEAYEIGIWLPSRYSCCSYYAYESDGFLEVCAEILFINETGITTANYTVTLSAASNSAQNGTDYTLVPTDLTFPDGSQKGARQCVIVNITDDEVVEYQESFYIGLSTNDTSIEIFRIREQQELELVCIHDNDILTVMGLTMNIYENNGSVQACVNITNGYLEAHSAYVRYSTNSGSAIGHEEFQVVQFNTIYFYSGDTVGDMRCATVGIVDDTKVEDDEFFNFEIFNGWRTQVAESSTRINILENDVALIGMETPTITVTEDTLSVSVCAVLINLVQLEIPLTAFVETQPVTATEDSDYAEEANTTINFFPGDFSGVHRCTNIAVNEDDILEYNEAFNVILKGNSSKLEIQADRNSMYIIIMEDDDYVNVGFQNLQFFTRENVSTKATVCAQIDSGSLEREIVVYLSTVAEGTAEEYNDYVPVDSLELTFTAGQSSSNASIQCTELDVLNNDNLENNETFSVRLTSDSDHVIITVDRGVAHIVVEEDDADYVVIGFPAEATLNVTEGGSAFANVCPQILEGTLEREVSVFATTVDISARASIDYADVVASELTFIAGQTVGDRQCISISIIQDSNVLEAQESFQLVLTAVETFIIIPSGQDGIIIYVNEDPLDGITVGLQQTSYNTLETGGPLSICAQMFVGDLEKNVSLTLASTDGSAKAPSDYTSLSTQLEFSTGQSVGTVACANLEIIDDNVVEVNEESLTLSLSPDDPSSTTTTTIYATVVIRENDNDVAGSVALNSSSYDAYESEGTVSVCAVIRAEALERNITVQLSSQDLTARNIQDYSAFHFVTITFDKGAAYGDEQCYQIAINDDTYLEDDEVFLVILTSNEHAYLGSSLTRAAVTIHHDAADFVELGFQQTNYSISEQATLRDAMICVIINSGNLEREIAVNLTVTDATTEGGVDYVGPDPLTLTFISGQTVGAQRCSAISAIDDTLIEAVETFSIHLTSSPSDEDSVRFTTGQDVATIIIVQDPNDRAVVQLMNFTEYGDEGDVIDVCAELVVIEGGLQRSLLVATMILSGTADYGIDFNSSSPSVLMFPVNSSQGDVQCITINLFNDTLLEVEENFVVELDNIDPVVTIIQNADLAIISIIDVPDPQAVGVLFSAIDYNATEANNISVEVCVEVVIGTVNQVASVNIQTVSQSATVDSDFLSLSTSLTFSPGDTIGSSPICVTVIILDDEVVEANEVFAVVLSSSSVIQTFGITSVNFTIYEDSSDFVTVGLQPSTSFVGESEIFLVCAQLTSGSLEREVYVHLEAENSSAMQGIDFIGPVPSILTFTSGQSTGGIQCSNVTILDNSVVEDERSFRIILKNDTTNSRVLINTSASSLDFIIAVDINDIVIMGLSSMVYQVTEGPSAVATVCATIQLGSVGREVAINLTTQATGAVSIATPNLDFVPLSETLTFSNGQQRGDSVCADIVIIPDDFVEADEMFNVMLVSSSLAVVIQSGKDQATVIILDARQHQSVVVQPSVSNVSVTEGITGEDGNRDPQAMVCIELVTGNLQRNVSVRIITISSPTSTARVNKDYQAIDINVTFTPGQNSSGDNQQCVYITIFDDTTLENSEIFDVLITTTSEDEDIVNITGQFVTVTIKEDANDFIEVGLLLVNSTVSENQTFPLCVELTNGILERNITIPLQVQAGLVAEGVDFIVLDPSTLTFVSGQSFGDVKCTSVTILDDSIPQGERNVSISIGRNEISSNSSDREEEGYGRVRVHPNLSSVTFTIELDLDDFIFVGLTNLIHEVTEAPNAVATVCATIEVATGSLKRNTSILIKTSLSESGSNTATPYLDFVPVTDDLIFTEGQSMGDSSCIDIIIVQDTFVETEETFEVVLLPNPNNILGAFIQPGKDRALVIITDGGDYKSVNIEPSQPRISIIESDDNGVLQVIACIELTRGNLQRNVTLSVMTSSSPTSAATVNEDYLDVELNVTFTSGQTASGDNQQCFYVPILNDNVLEHSETFDILIAPTSEDEDVVNVTTQVITVTIEEDPTDNVRIGFVDSRFIVTESVDTSISVCAELQQGSLERNVTINIVVSNGSNATFGVDFRITTSVLTFTSGQYGMDGVTQCSAIEILNDQDIEYHESLMLSIRPVEEVAGAVVIPAVNSMVSVIILEDPNDEVKLQPLESVAMVTEGENATVCVAVSNGSLQRDILVTVKTVSGLTSTATTGEDFSEVMTTMTVSSSQLSCTNVTILNDDILEGCEAFFIAFEVDPNFSGVAAIPKEVDKSVVVIMDDLTDKVELGFNQSDFYVTEGQTDAIDVCVEITSGTLQRNVSVHFNTVNKDHGALLSNDYMYKTMIQEQKLTFGPSISSVCIPIIVLNDDALESTENFTLVLSHSARDLAVVSFSVQQATVEIFEDSIDEVTVGLSELVLTTYEDGGSVQVCANLLKGELGTNITLLIDSEAEFEIDSATIGKDYFGLPQVLTFVVGQTIGALSCINITIIDDDIVEDKENFTVKLLVDFPGVSVSRGLSVVEIVDNDKGSLTVTTKVSIAVGVALFVLLTVFVIILTVIVKKYYKKGRAFTYDVSQAFENTSVTESKLDIPAIAVDHELQYEKTDLSTFKPMDTSL